MLDKIFGTGPNWSLFQPIQGELTWLWGVMLAVGLVSFVVVFALNGFRLGTAGSDMGKSASAIMGLKNVVFGVAAVLIGIPMLLAVIEGVSAAF